MPSGSDLKEWIARDLNLYFENDRSLRTGDEIISHVLHSHASKGTDLIFSDLFKKCKQIVGALPGAISIDNLVEAHRDDNDIAFIAKVAIVRSILKAEKRSKLFTDWQNGDVQSLAQAAGTWLIPFWQMLSEGVQKPEAEDLLNDVNLIVFNYDRSIEYFLILCFEKYYSFSRGQAELIVSRANIVHPYGTAGVFQSQDSREMIGYGGDTFELAPLANMIRTFSEGLANVDHKGQIDTYIQSAENIVFLGFAFHPMNIALLSPGEPSKAKRVFGTTYGIAEPATRIVHRTILELLHKFGVDEQGAALKNNVLAELSLSPEKSYEFLNSFFRSIAD